MSAMVTRGGERATQRSGDAGEEKHEPKGENCPMELNCPSSPDIHRPLFPNFRFERRGGGVRVLVKKKLGCILVDFNQEDTLTMLISAERSKLFLLTAVYVSPYEKKTVPPNRAGLSVTQR